MKKIKTALATLLSLTCLFATTACEGLQFVTMGGNSTGVEESSSKPRTPLTKKQKEELDEALEKIINTENVTHKYDTIILESGTNPGDDDSYWDETKMTGTTKIADNMMEEIQTEKTRLEKGGKWETDKEKIYNIYTSEDEGVCFFYFNGSWHNNPITHGKKESLFGLSKEIEEEIFEQFEYIDGVYIITDYEMDLDLTQFFGDVVVEGTAHAVVNECSVEIEDGYISKMYLNQIIDADAIVELEGEKEEVTLHMELEFSFTFTNYGTTKITLPDDIKDEVEELLKNS